MDVNEQIQNQPILQNIPSGGGSSKNKKVIILAGVLIGFFIVLIGLLTVLIFQKKSGTAKNTPPISTSPDNPLLATVGDEKIYKSTVEKAAAEQYDPNHLTDAIIKRYLDVVIERAILGIEADVLNVAVTDADIQQYKKNNPQETNENTIKYAILKDKIMQKQLRNMQAFTISYWAPPLTEPQSPTDDEVRQTGQTALDSAQQRIQNKENVFAIAKDLYNQYPILQKSLTLNGYVLNGYLSDPNADTTMLVQPKIYALSQEEMKDLDDPAFYNALYSMQTGQIQQIQPSDSSGKMLIYVVNATPEGFANYQDFLDERRKELVTKY